MGDGPWILANEAFQHELHKFLWTEPQHSKKPIDYGWNCRDQAYVVAVAASCYGHRATIEQSRAFFVREGLGQEGPYILEQNPHTWTRVDASISDLSIRMADVPHWRTPVFHVLNSKAWPAVEVTVRQFDDFDAMARLCAEKSHGRDGRTHALYLKGQEDEVLVDYRPSTGLIGTPLAKRLIADYGAAVYAKLVLHLLAVAEKESEPLNVLSYEKRWSIVNRKWSDDEALEAIETRTRRALV